MVGIFTIVGYAEGAATAGYNIVSIKITTEDGGVGDPVPVRKYRSAACGKTAVEFYPVFEVKRIIAGSAAP